MVALLALGGVLAAAERGGGSSGAGREPSAAGVRRVHVGLHAIDRVCSRPRIGSAAHRRLEGDARRFARFAATYPRARFRIDGEDARALSLLLVARQTLERCDRRAAAIVDRALPPGMRQRP